LPAKKFPLAKIYPYALGDKPGSAHLEVPPGNSGAAFISMTNKSGEVVEVRTLDSFDLDAIDFIKLDCEGYEYPALLGAAETINRNKPVISIEQKKGSPGRYDEGKDQYHALNYIINHHKYQILGRVVDDWVLGPYS
jgi:hypothetical protein